MGMNTTLVYGLSVAVAYLVGSIPFGFLIGKMRGVDVRTVGSKNIGATNVYRTVGHGWGLLAFFCDFLKGLLPTLGARAVAAHYGDNAAMIAGLAFYRRNVTGETAMAIDVNPTLQPGDDCAGAQPV